MDLDAPAIDHTPTADDIAQAIAAYLPLQASRASFAEWLAAAWGDYTDTAIDITVGAVLSAGLRDWRGDEAPRLLPPTA